MAVVVTNFALKTTDRSASVTATDDKFVRKYTRVYSIQTQDAATESEIVNLIFGLLPGIGNIHPEDALARVKSRQAVAVKGPRTWEVTVDWDTETGDEEEEPDPIERRPVVSVSTINYTRPLEKDAEGRQVVNTVGEPFNPSLETEDMRALISIAVNLPSVNPDWLLSFRRHVNAGNLTILDKVQLWMFSEGTLLFHGFNVAAASENNIDYYKVSYAFQHKATGWNPREVLNTGFKFFEKFGGPGAEQFAVHNVRDASGADLNQPVLLNEDGTQAPLPLPDSFDAHYVKVDEFPKRSFQQLFFN